MLREASDGVLFLRSSAWASRVGLPLMSDSPRETLTPNSDTLSTSAASRCPFFTSGPLWWFTSLSAPRRQKGNSEKVPPRNSRTRMNVPFSGMSLRTPRSISSCRLFLTEIFLSSAEMRKRTRVNHRRPRWRWRRASNPPTDVSVNFSLGFFFLHFQGLKSRPTLANLPLRLAGGVLPPEFSSSPRVALGCRSASSSAWNKKTDERQPGYVQTPMRSESNPISTNIATQMIPDSKTSLSRRADDGGGA